MGETAGGLEGLVSPATKAMILWLVAVAAFTLFAILTRGAF